MHQIVVRLVELVNQIAGTLGKPVSPFLGVSPVRFTSKVFEKRDRFIRREERARVRDIAIAIVEVSTNDTKRDFVGK